MAATRLCLALALLLAAAAAPSAALRLARFKEYTVMLGAVPTNATGGVGAAPSGMATLTLKGSRLVAELSFSGLAPSLPHAVLLRGSASPADGAARCPVAGDDADADGVVTASEAMAATGGPVAAVTTRGSFAATNALRLNRMPVADADGNLRTTLRGRVNADVVEVLENLVLVVHGVDADADGSYAADAAEELLLPAGCGGLALRPKTRRVKKVKYTLEPIPHDMAADGGSEVTGTLSARVKGDRLFLEGSFAGLSPGLPHAMHLHGSLAADADVASCPTAEAQNEDGIVTVVAGVPSYGGIVLSLTTSGDMSPASALALDRFGVAAMDGTLAYKRIMRVDPALVERLEDLHVVIHGIDLNGNDEYDFEAGPSSLGEAFPLEGTVPAACGGAELTTRAKKVEVDLSPIPHSEAALTASEGGMPTGSARFALRDRRLTVTIEAEGMAPRLPHAMHLHALTNFNESGACPDMSARNEDGIVTVVAGVPFYGGIVLSLTTSGDSTGASALALDRFPVADESGRLTYKRTFFNIDPALADGLENVQLVLHGIDLNGNEEYDFEAGPSSLGEAFPLEGTVPAACGEATFATRSRRFKNLQIALEPVPHDETADGGSAVSGVVSLRLKGNTLRVLMEVTGASPGLFHAQHLHGSLAAGAPANRCPTAEARDAQTDDGLISVVEGAASYGGIVLSLTTSGDSSAASALDAPRFPVAAADGTYRYRRVFRVSDALADRLEDLHLVVHGVDVNNNAEYDFGAGPSSLTDSLPLEATLPAACAGAEFEIKEGL